MKSFFCPYGLYLRDFRELRAGAVGASALGVQPVYGVLAVNGVSFLSGLCGGFMPSGAACAGLYTEAWTGFMIKAFRTDPEGLGWYSKIRSFDQYVEKT